MSSSHVHVVRPSPISVLPDPNNMLISSLNAIKEVREEREKGKGREGGRDPDPRFRFIRRVPRKRCQKDNGTMWRDRRLENG